MENPSTHDDSAASATPMAEMNMTPMIDVMLVLILMFMLTLPIAQHAVNLEMPRGCEGSCDRSDVVRVDVDFDGSLSWNGEILDKAQLDARFAAIKAMAKQPEVQLMAHRLVSYKEVAAVLASAQSHGVTSLGIIGSERFMPH